MPKINSFFDKHYETPAWLLNKQSQQQVNPPTIKKTSRRALLKGGLKAAGGASVVATIPLSTWAMTSSDSQNSLAGKIKKNPWLTLDAVVNHLLPTSDSGPGAKDINALTYLYNVVHLQPTEQNEIDFIYKGVGWLNGYSQSQHQQNFSELPVETKETLLRGISRSKAGENWLNTLLGYVMEALLTPPIYGGNTDQKGWQWLEHSGGYPLPAQGTRYYEIPNQQTIKISFMPRSENAQTETNMLATNIKSKQAPALNTRNGHKGKKA